MRSWKFGGYKNCPKRPLESEMLNNVCRKYQWSMTLWKLQPIHISDTACRSGWLFPRICGSQRRYGVQYSGCNGQRAVPVEPVLFYQQLCNDNWLIYWRYSSRIWKMLPCLQCMGKKYETFTLYILSLAHFNDYLRCRSVCLSQRTFLPSFSLLSWN